MRERAFAALTETYRHVGQRIWRWIGDKENSRHANLQQQLRDCFADVDAPADAPPCARHSPPRRVKAAATAPRVATAHAAATNGNHSNDAAAAAGSVCALFGVPSVPRATPARPANAFAALSEPLVDVASVDWKQRVTALREMRALADGVDDSAHASLGAAAHAAHRQLAAQVLDLRSAVCKEACATLVALSRALGAHFAACADECVPALLKLTYVTKEIMATSGHRCLCELIASTRLRSGVAAIARAAATSSNATLRARCQEYLALLLAPSAPSAANVDAHADAVMTALHKGLTDASPVRNPRCGPRAHIAIGRRREPLRDTVL